MNAIKIVKKPGILLAGLCLIFCFAGCSADKAPRASGEEVIIHTVMFSLKTSPDSEETRNFLRDGKEILTAIPGVENFEVRRQVSAKNSFQYGFSMHFADSAAFEEYLNHPLHVSFVRERWEKEVSGFMEADYKAYPLD